MRVRNVVLTGMLLAVGLGIGFAGAQEPGPQERFQKIRAAMSDRNYPEAERLALQYAMKYSGTPRAEEAEVLALRARFGLRRLDDTVKLALGFLSAESRRESPWREKVRFIMADAHARAKGFEDAARIFRDRIETLAAPDHQAAIAGDYLAIANVAYDGVETKDEFGRVKVVKNHGRALEFLRKARAIHEDPATRDVLRHRIADSAFHLKKYGEAIKEWKALLEKDDKSKLRDEATYRVGESYLASGRMAEARTFLRDVVTKYQDSPRVPEARILLGRSYSPLGNRDEEAFRQGIAWWEEFTRLHFSDDKAPQVFFDLAVAYGNHGDHEQAIGAFESFLERFADHEKAPEAQYRMGESSLRRRDFDRAIADFKTFLGRWPNNPLWTKAQEMIVEADFLRGEFPYREKKWDAATAAWTKFLETHPVAKKAPLVQYRLGEIEHQKKNHDAAIAKWRILAAKYPKDALARKGSLRVASTIEYPKKDLDAALKEYEEIIKLYPRTNEAQQAGKAIAAMRAKVLSVFTKRAFGTDEKPTLNLKLRNIPKLQFKAYRLDLEEYFRRKHRVAAIEDVVVAIVKPDHEWTWEQEDYAPYLYVVKDVAMPFSGPGAWIVTCGQEDLTASTLMLVSDLQVVVKHSPKQIFAFVINARTGEPQPNARVLLGDAGKVFAEGKTGADGTWIVDAKKEHRDVRVLAIDEGKHCATSGGTCAGGTSWGYSTKAFLYTDRPLYRPGQTVEFRGIIRKVAGGDYATPVGETVKLWVSDTRGTVLYEKELKTSDYGTVADRLALPSEAHLGDYVIRARYRDKDFQTGFKVMEYRKPEFTAAITTARPTYHTGDTVEASVALRYTFGGAVAGTSVTYQVYHMPFMFDADALRSFAWFFADPKRAEERRRHAIDAMQHVAEGSLTTDEKGVAKFTFETERVEKDRAYVVSVRAQDINREWISDQKTVFVTQKGWFAVVKTDKKIYRPKERVRADLTTVNAMQLPVATKGKVVIVRRRAMPALWDSERLTGHIVFEPVANYPVETGVDGKGTASFRIEGPGEYLVRYEGKDERGGVVVSSTPVDISGEAEDLAKQARIVAEQEIYMEGDVAKVLVNTPKAPALALLTIEGEKVLGHRIVRLEKRSTTLTVPMEARFSPNVFIKIAIPTREAFFEAEEEVAVLKFLNVAIEADPGKAKPGDKVKATLRATDQKGQPVQAELSLAVVDRAIFALAPDGTPDIKPTFYDQRRKNAVKTNSSVAFRYAGTTRPTNKDLLAEQTRRLGAAAYRALKNHVKAGREALEAGDVKAAADLLVQAAAISPDDYEVRTLLVRLKARLGAEAIGAPRPERSAEDARLGAQLDLLERKLGVTADKRVAPGAESSPAEGMVTGSARRMARGGGRPGSKKSESRWANSADEEMEEGFADDPVLGDTPVRGRMFRVRKDAKNKSNSGILAGAAGYIAHDEAQQALMPATLRETFADTALWTSAVRTNAAGVATVELTLPDNLTTWRLTARGVSKGTLVGEARSSVISTKPLLVRVDTPRFLTQGDRTTITSTVHNNTGEATDVTVDIAAGNVDLAGSTSTSATIRDGGADVFEWRLNAESIGLARLEATARSGRGSDAIRHGFRTLPYGLRHLDGRSGVVDGEALEVLDRPEDVIPGTLRFVLTLSPDVDGSLLEGIGYLERFPYGCLEQTINRFLPAIAAHEALRTLGIPDEAMKKKVGEIVSRGLNSLYAFQANDGSFGWWTGGRNDAVMTAYAVIAMERARLAGYRVNANNRNRALSAAARLLRGADNVQKAFLLHALALGGKANFTEMNAVYRHRDGLDPIGLAVLALGFHESGRAYNSHELVRMLSEGAKVDGDQAHWGSAPTKKSRRGGFLSGDVETTAYALLALLKTEPTSPLCDAAARWLEARRSGPAWGTTKATGIAIQALAAWQQTRKAARHDFTVEIWWNGELYQKVPVRGGKIAARDRTVLLDAARIRTGRNDLKLVRVGSGTFRYALSYEYVTPAETIEAAGNLMEISRRYVEYVSPLKEKASGARIPEGYSIFRPEARPKKAEAKSLVLAGSGDRIRVVLALTARESLDYVIVEDPLPAGVEVVEGQTRGRFDHEERRDESQVFFLSHVKAGEKIELSYLCQAIHPGSYRALPTVAYPMYEPEIFGRAAGARLEVSPESGVVGRRRGAETLTPDSIFHLAKKAFADEKWEQARDAFAGLVKTDKLIDGFHEECLWYLMKCGFACKDARAAVESHEALRERNPRRGVATRDEKLALAASYFEIGEHERSLVLYRALGDELFLQEARVAETYKELGDPHRSQAVLAGIVKRYPDSGQVMGGEWEIARRYFDLRRAPKKIDGKKPRIGGPALMLPEALEGYASFAAHHPEHAQADAAGYMTIASLQKMSRLDEAIAEAEAFRRRYPKSVQLAKVVYDLCTAYFDKGDFQKAREVGQEILTRHYRYDRAHDKTRASQYRPNVTFLMGQMAHIEGRYSAAVRFYDQVKGRFTDASDALAFFTATGLKLPESVVCGVDQPASVEAETKNLESIELKVYEVDLMILFAVRKDLQQINRIDLTGIVPVKEWTVKLGESKDYRWHAERIPVPADHKGVYLVVAKGGDHDGSTVVIKSDLEIKVQRVDDRVRVYAFDRKTREPMKDVYVKVGDGSVIRAQGLTDACGVFEARGVRGQASVVAEKDGHYALSR
jgi:alpha-2-macroglobulin